MRALAASLCLLAACAAANPGPLVIGAVERVRVIEADLGFRARIDTGAEASSIHAREVRLEGTRVHFTVENTEGERRALSAEVVDLAHVRSAGGTELRPRVALHLALAGVEKRVLVSLRDRSRMSYRLLVGRDFLSGDFLVDAGRGEAGSERPEN